MGIYYFVFADSKKAERNKEDVRGEVQTVFYWMNQIPIEVQNGRTGSRHVGPASSAEEEESNLGSKEKYNRENMRHRLGCCIAPFGDSYIKSK